jgi:hypothetical protein
VDKTVSKFAIAELDGIPVFIIGKDALIRNKRAVGRKQKLVDLEILEN